MAFWGALLLVAALAKSKPLLFSWAFFMITAMPIAFVLPRGASQYYIPIFGCALYAGCGLAGRLGPGCATRIKMPIVLVWDCRLRRAYCLGNRFGLAMRLSWLQEGGHE